MPYRINVFNIGNKALFSQLISKHWLDPLNFAQWSSFSKLLVSWIKDQQPCLCFGYFHTSSFIKGIMTVSALVTTTGIVSLYELELG